MFGKRRDIEWKPVVHEGQQADLRAAVLQHQVVMQIRHVMHERGMTNDADLAAPTGLSVSQIGRVLRGQSAMTFNTLTAIEVALRTSLVRPAGAGGSDSTDK